MDNMKPLAFAEAEMPLHRLDPVLARDIERFVRTMVDAASLVVDILSFSLRRALFGAETKVKFDRTLLESARERYWEITEEDFHKTLDEACAWLVEDPHGDQQEKLAQLWRITLKKAVFGIFDDTAPIDSFEVLEPENVVEGRKILALSLEGYTKNGAALFKALGLSPPKGKTKPVRGSRTRTGTEKAQ